MWNRTELKFRGKQAFRRNYAEAVGASLIFTFLSGLFSLNTGTAGTARDVADDGVVTIGPGASSFGSNTFRGLTINIRMTMALLLILLVLAVVALALRFFVVNVLEVGKNRFFLYNQTEKAKMKRILEGFTSGHYMNLVKTMLLRDVFLFLLSLLLIIPGIVKSYEYLMIPYILADNPGMNWKEASQISRRMMTGQKWNAFVLDLSFLGWFLLDYFTCGILGVLMVNPYYEATLAELYAYNKSQAYQEGYIR